MGLDREDLSAVAAVLAAVVPDDPLTRHVRTRAGEPWRVGVIGRVGVGKTTLIQRLAGRGVGPTGLGGVTKDPVEIAISPGIVVVDTPGIDAPDEAIPLLAGVLGRCDAVIAVIDGLQPLAASERVVLARAVPPGTPLQILVSRADLVEPDEIPSVLARIRELSGREAIALDMRRDLLPPDLLTPGSTSPRREAEDRAALEAARIALDGLPELPDRDAILERVLAGWRASLRRVEAAVFEEIDAGRLTARAGARVDRLAREALDHALAGIRPGMPEIPALRAPTIPRPADGEAAGWRREARTAVGRWLHDGEMLLAERVEAVGEAERAARQEARRVLLRVVV